MMIHKIRRWAVACIALAILFACDKGEDTPPKPEVAPQTVLMYFPWSGNLTDYFRTNIADMEKVVASGVLNGERVLVFFMDAPASAELFELRYRNGKCIRETVKRYETAPAVTTADGIASILGAVRTTAPAQRYAMTIGSHGMAWLPAARTATDRASAGAAPAEKEYWEYASDGYPLTRWFGGLTAAYQAEIETLAEGIARTGMKMEYILFDDCYMSSIEVAYALRGVADHLIGSPCEVMATGFPYADMGRYLIGEVDYAAICEAFYDFYISYQWPHGTIGVTNCAELDALADVMRRINDRYTFAATQNLDELQALDGYSPVRFFDMGDYVRHLCGDAALLAEFEEQLERTVPAAYRRHTPEYYSNGRTFPIHTYSGITTSDPSISSLTVDAKRRTEWWRATHRTGE